MPKTSIEWVRNDDGSEGYSWPVINGCLPAGPGCEHCYAMRLAATRLKHTERYKGLARFGSNGPQWTGAVRLVEKELTMPLRLRKPSRIFVCDMGDLFYEEVTDAMIDRVFAVMMLAPQHTFIVLTKRAERMRAYLSDPTLYERVLVHADALRASRSDLTMTGVSNPTTHPPPWIWWGVSVENQDAADERVPLLLQTPAAVRFLSVEPLLGPVNLDPPHCQYCPDDLEDLGHADDGTPWCMRCDSEMAQGWWLEPLDDDGQPLNGPAINWVITGGESGPRARPASPQWFRNIRDQCVASGVAYFHKQNGEYASVSEVEGPGEHFTFPDGRTVRRVGKKRAGRELDGRTWDEFPKGAPDAR